jgi:DNA-binding IclR family transcriptional regulator
MTKTIEPAAPRVTKAAKLLTLLQTGTGASLEDMAEATGWQPHTVRAAMTGLKKKGHTIEKHVEGNTTIWSAKVVTA